MYAQKTRWIIKVVIILGLLCFLMFESVFAANAQAVSDIYDELGNPSILLIQNSTHISNRSNITVTHSSDITKHSNLSTVGGYTYLEGYTISAPTGTTTHTGSYINLKINDAAVNINTGELYDVNIKMENFITCNKSGVAQRMHIGGWHNDGTFYELVARLVTSSHLSGVKCQVTISFSKQNGTTAPGTFNWTFRDLDMPDCTTGIYESSTVGGTYAESINFKSGVVNGQYYVSNNTELIQNGNRFYHKNRNTTTSAQSHLTGVSVLANASGLVLDWAGSDCGTELLSMATDKVSSVDVVHKSTTGTILKDRQYVLQNRPLGTKYTTSSSTFSGYRYVGLASNSAAASGALGSKVLHVIYEYVPLGSVRVRYITDTGTTIKAWEWVKQNVDAGTSYTTSALPSTTKSSRGFSYTLVTRPSNYTGNVVQGTTNVTWVYSENGSVRVRHIDEKGNVIENWTFVKNDVAKGTSYSTSQKSFAGYTYKSLQSGSASASGTVESGVTKDVTFVYTRDTSKISIKKITDRIDVVDVYHINDSKFTVYEDMGCTKIVKDYITGQELKDLVIDASGKTSTFTIPTYSNGGSNIYYIKEVFVSEWFKEPIVMTATMTKDNTIEITFENQLKAGNGQVNKVF